VSGVGLHELEDRPHDLAEHRAQVGPGVLLAVHLDPQPGLTELESTHDGRRGHPHVDAEAGHVRLPDVLVEVVLDQPLGDPEVAADGLPYALPVERARQVVGDRVGDGAVELVAPVVRGDEVVPLEDGVEDVADPLGLDGDKVGVEDRHGPGPQEIRHLEGGPQARPLPRNAPVDRDDLPDVVRVDLHEVRNLARVVRGSPVGDENDGLGVGIKALETCGDGLDHVHDGPFAVIGGNPDDDVRVAELLDRLAGMVPEGCRETGCRHRGTVLSYGRCITGPLCPGSR